MKFSWQQIKDGIMENGSYKIVALLITLILWITVLGNKDQVLNQMVRLNFSLPKNHIIANSITDRVQVQISGSRLSLKKLIKGIEPIEINLEDAKPGRTIVSIPTDHILLPFGAQILSVTPANLVIDIDRVMTKRVPVKVSWDTDEEPKNIRVSDLRPSSVIIRGASSVLSRIDEAWTEPISPQEIIFDKYKKSVEVRVGLKDFNYYGVLPFDNKNVIVTITPK
jgi:YbbR domain-containing protein